jgi:hypothetical protein
MEENDDEFEPDEIQEDIEDEEAGPNEVRWNIVFSEDEEGAGPDGRDEW